jgi:hypothetical protein
MPEERAPLPTEIVRNFDVLLADSLERKFFVAFVCNGLAGSASATH